MDFKKAQKLQERIWKAIVDINRVEDSPTETLAVLGTVYTKLAKKYKNNERKKNMLINDLDNLTRELKALLDIKNKELEPSNN